MAQLVNVYRSDDHIIERRQLPLAVDDKLKLVIQFSDTCMGCNQIAIKQQELEKFVQKYRTLSSDEVAIALMVTNKEIFSLLGQMVPCVGCRKSVERLFKQVSESGHPALEPLVITKTSGLSIERNVLFEPKALYALFYIHGSKLNMVMEGIPKSKKNKRCILHSLDSHKSKSLAMWKDVWDIMSPECRDEVSRIECDSLMITLESYLRKHRFCSECKAKVLRAYSILVGELESALEKGYCKALYDGLSYCAGEKHDKRHIHVTSETEFIGKLMGRAEPELTGSRRERHAKTLDIAQEEVLTCLGIHLFERLHRIWQKVRAEEQTWQILFYLGVDALRKNFETELEHKQGISQLELTCRQLLEEEQALEQRREQKRQKRKKKKNRNKLDGSDAQVDAEFDKEKENCQCDENTNVTTTTCASCDKDNHVALTNGCKKGHAAIGAGDSPFIIRTRRGQQKICESCNCDLQRQEIKETIICRSDCGYSSGHECCDSCSVPSSNDGSDIACLEGMCNHEGDSALCHRNDFTDVCENCCDANMGLPRKHHSLGYTECICSCHEQSIPLINGARYGTAPSLQDMLEASCCSGDEEDYISEEEIQRFKANQTVLNSQRLELRETLRKRFANMCMCKKTNCVRSIHRHVEEPHEICVSVKSSPGYTLVKGNEL